MASPLRYKRVLLKVSGEALLGGQAFGIDDGVMGRIAGEIAEAVKLGVKIGVVTGGGNIFRGMTIQKAGGNRVAGDQMGMLATVMNSIALQQKLGALGVPTRIFSAVAMPSICETFNQRAAEAAFEAGDVLLFAAGIGNPFVTTDSGAALRAAEMGCDALFKGTQVDGVYSADPKKDKTAKRHDRLTYDDVLSKGLQVMDVGAIALARDNRIPVIVFSILQPGAFVDILKGKGRATVV
ncbi:MAG: UMP kinase, partial [Bauldia sp.]|nr:UMP kinase [Bauldia sp.]